MDKSSFLLMNNFSYNEISKNIVLHTNALKTYTNFYCTIHITLPLTIEFPTQLWSSLSLTFIFNLIFQSAYYSVHFYFITSCSFFVGVKLSHFCSIFEKFHFKHLHAFNTSLCAHKNAPREL